MNKEKQVEPDEKPTELVLSDLVVKLKSELTAANARIEKLKADGCMDDSIIAYELANRLLVPADKIERALSEIRSAITAAITQQEKP